jgi:nucleoside-diphosphate-sugar epimerase
MDDLHIFGASGAVGGFLIARLRAEQHPAIAWTHRTPAPAADAGDCIAWRRIDLWRDTNPTAAATLISAGPLDAFVAWLQRVDTPRLQRIVALSSMSIISKRDAADPDERAVAERLQRGEQSLRDICAARGIAWTILRPTLIWGASRDLGLTPLYRFARRFGFLPLPWSMGGQRQPVHAADVATAIQLALSSAASISKEIALGGGEVLPVALMWRRVALCARAFQLPLPLWSMRLASHALGARGYALRSALQRWALHQHVDNVAARELLAGWEPRSFRPLPSDFDAHAQLDASSIRSRQA